MDSSVDSHVCGGFDNIVGLADDSAVSATNDMLRQARQCRRRQLVRVFSLTQIRGKCRRRGVPRRAHYFLLLRHSLRNVGRAYSVCPTSGDLAASHGLG